MRIGRVGMGRRIAAGMLGYAVVLMLVYDVGEQALDLLWAALTLPLEAAGGLTREILLGGIAVGSVIPVVAGLVGIGLAAVARLLIWPVTVASSRPETPARQQGATAHGPDGIVALAPDARQSEHEPAVPRAA